MNDHDIKTFLQTMAGEVQDAHPLTRSALRRARTRRMALAATTVVSVVCLAVAGTGLALTSGGPGGGGSIAPAGNDSTPPPPNPMPGTLVAHGESGDGGEWWLSADAPDSGDICTYLQHDTGDIQQDCRAYTEDADDMGFGRDKLKDGVFGWVPDDTTKLWVTDSVEYVDGGPEDEEPEEESEESEDEEPAGEGAESDGGEPGEGPKDVTIEGEEELELYDAPEGFPYPVEFYALVPAPENAETLLIKLNDQDMVALIVGRPPYDPDEEPNERTLVAEGEHDGYSWELFEKIKDDDLRCLDLRWADERLGSGAGCSSAVPDDESFQFVMVHFGEDNGIAFFGAVAEEVETLEIVHDDGKIETLEIVEGPEGSDVDYVVGWPSLDEDGGLHGSARTLDENGYVLDTMRLCELGGPNSGCSSDYRP